MASSINSSNIDGTFPIAGQDNDTQGFRDNFTNIKSNFVAAKNEIENLQSDSNSGNFSLFNNVISVTNTNGGIELSPDGTGTVTTDNLQFFQNTISTTNTDGDLVLDPNGVGVIDFAISTQTTVGSAGSASGLPTTPSGYLNIKINGLNYVIPYYASS